MNPHHISLSKLYPDLDEDRQDSNDQIADIVKATVQQLNLVEQEQQQKSSNRSIYCCISLAIIVFISLAYIFFTITQLSPQNQNTQTIQKASQDIPNAFENLNNSNENDEHKKQVKLNEIISSQSKPQSKKQNKSNTFTQQLLPELQLPLKLPIINSKGIRIQNFLYENDEVRSARMQYQRQRILFINNHSNQFNQLHLAKHNLILDAQGQKQAAQDNEAEWVRLTKKYGLSEITDELPMCIISPSFNNVANFRIEYSLNSILTQNYSNYKLIIINDASTDASHQMYQKYIRFISKKPRNIIYIQNKQRLTALQNIYNTATNYCGKDQIVMVIDGDDELIGRNVFKLFNWAYQRHKAGVVYSNFYWYIQSVKVVNGYTSTLQYSEQEIRQSLFRKKAKISQLRSFRNELFLKINQNDLKDSNGQFYKMTYDFAIFIPLLEMSCSRLYKFKEEYHYLYNANTGLNDGVKDRGQQWVIEQELKNKPSYSCSREFDSRMKK